MRLRTLAFSVAALGAAVGLAVAAISGWAAGPLSVAPSCVTRGLVVWLDTRADHAAGSAYYKLELTNLSGHACVLSGYPGVSAVGLAGHQLGNPASRDHANVPRPVSLANGATAAAVLRIVDVGNFPRSACRRIIAAGLRVFPPGQKTSRLAPFPFAACSRAGPVYMTIRAVQKG